MLVRVERVNQISIQLLIEGLGNPKKLEKNEIKKSRIPFLQANKKNDFDPTYLVRLLYWLLKIYSGKPITKIVGINHLLIGITGYKISFLKIKKTIATEMQIRKASIVISKIILPCLPTLFP